MSLPITPSRSPGPTTHVPLVVSDVMADWGSIPMPFFCVFMRFMDRGAARDARGMIERNRDPPANGGQENDREQEEPKPRQDRGSMRERDGTCPTPANGRRDMEPTGSGLSWKKSEEETLDRLRRFLRRRCKTHPGGLPGFHGDAGRVGARSRRNGTGERYREAEERPSRATRKSLSAR